MTTQPLSPLTMLLSRHTRRREFITLLGGAAAWPVAARAQQLAMPVIGFLDGQSFDPYLMTAFRQALKDVGYIEGRNVGIYFRSADGQTDRLVTLAGDIVGRRVAVIVTTGGGAAALAAYAATTTIPIVFVNGVDPVTSGLVMSLNRPGANATGVYIFQQVLEEKRLGLLRGLVPATALIAVLLNPTNANFQTQLRGVQDASRALGQQVSILSASTERDIDMAFATVTESRAGALLVGSDPFFNNERDQVVALAARHAIPAIYEGFCHGRRLGKLRHEPRRCLSSGRHLRWPDSQGRETCRSACRTANPVRVRDQREDCEGAWPRRADCALSERRRGHRMRPFDPSTVRDRSV
jgi:ABC-type uncharacterized transport system substrate-binding protein